MLATALQDIVSALATTAPHLDAPALAVIALRGLAPAQAATVLNSNTYAMQQGPVAAERPSTPS